MTIEEKTYRNSAIIKHRRDDKLTVKQIADKFNMSINQVFVILRRYREQQDAIKL